MAAGPQLLRCELNEVGSSLAGVGRAASGSPHPRGPVRRWLPSVAHAAIGAVVGGSLAGVGRVAPSDPYLRGPAPAPVGGARCHRRSRGWLVRWSGEGGTGRPLPARSSAGRPPSVASAAIGAVYTFGSRYAGVGRDGSRAAHPHGPARVVRATASRDGIGQGGRHWAACQCHYRRSTSSATPRARNGFLDSCTGEGAEGIAAGGYGCKRLCVGLGYSPCARCTS
jgi:hypothetical protein